MPYFRFPPCDLLGFGRRAPFETNPRYLLSLEPFVLTPDIARMIMSNFDEFYRRGSFGWEHFTEDMKSALASTAGLASPDRWLPRRMTACVCCARMYWTEDLERRHLAGLHSDWLRNPDAVWNMLSVRAYSQRCPRIPVEELEASAVEIAGTLVLLHKRRCSPAVVSGDAPAAFCRDCAEALSYSPPRWPLAALANLNWLGRVTKRQMELMQPKRLGHRLLLSLARIVTTKLVFRPAGSIGQGAFWQEAFHAKGMKGSAIVVDSASKHFSKSFPPRSLGNSFVAVFAGPEGTSVDASIFGDVDANDFRADATALRQVNEVYAESCLDEEELRSWPAQPGVPQALLSSMLAVPVPDVDVEDEAPGTVGPAHMTSGHGQHEKAVVPPWVSAWNATAGEENSMPMLWSLLGEKLEEAVALGDGIRVQELEAKIRADAETLDELQREVLLTTCTTLKDCFRKLSQPERMEKFEALCARVIGQNASDNVESGDLADAGAAAGAAQHADQKKRLVVPTGKHPLSLFDYKVWTMLDPVCFWYGDVAWGHPMRPQPISVQNFVELCCRREELEYRTAREVANNEPCAALPVNRFRSNYKVLRVLRTFWDLHSKIRSVYAFTSRRGNSRALRSLSKLTPQMLSDCFSTLAGHKNLGAVLQDRDVPSVLRNALNQMQLATQDVIDTDANRRLLRHEGNAYAARFGPSAIFLTPNLPQQRHITVLLTRSEPECADWKLELDFPELMTLGDMMKVCGDDPVGVAFADDLMFRLFQCFILGISRHCVGTPRGQPMDPRHVPQYWDNSAAANTHLGIFGPPQAARGPLEASGRAALHGHWRIWMRSIDYRRALQLFQHQPELVEERLRLLTTQVLDAAVPSYRYIVSRLAPDST